MDGPFGPAPGICGLTDALSGPLGGLAIQKLRIRPLQKRSIQSIERILSSAAEMLFLDKRRKQIDMNAIAGAARMTPQAIYRYFRNSDELVKAVLRCLAIHEYQRIIAGLSGRVLANEAEMASAVVAVVLETCGRLARYPAHLQADITQEYQQIGYDAALTVSKIICADAGRTDVRASLDVIGASVALTAIVAVATSFFSKDVASSQQDRLEQRLATLFVGVLQSGGASSAAFREIGIAFDVAWGDKTG